MKSVHDLLGMALVTVEEGIRLGTVEGVAIETAANRIAYLSFAGAQGRADGVVPWEAVRFAGGDAVTVETAACVLPAIPGQHQDRLSALVGDRPVMTESGTRLGRITGYDVDETTGSIERYHVATGGFFGRLTHSELTFPPAAIRGFGPDAIVVADEVTRPKEREGG